MMKAEEIMTRSVVTISGSATVADAVELMKEKDLQFDYQLYFAQEELIDLLYTYKLSHEQRALPLNLVINTEGKVVTYYMGNQPEKLGEIRTYLESL